MALSFRTLISLSALLVIATGANLSQGEDTEPSLQAPTVLMTDAPADANVLSTALEPSLREAPRPAQQP